MCGIIGYTGSRSALPILLDGLKRLEYRGYDSAGVCLLNTGRATRVRSAGRLKNLKEKFDTAKVPATTGIAHTRWATHGPPTEANAHPHTDCTGQIFLAHNGIIENFSSLKAALESNGHKFSSATDTEALVHLIEDAGQDIPLEQAVIKALNNVAGAFGIVVVSVSEPEKIVAARRSSPLLIGVGQNEYFVASDATPLISHTREVVYLNDDELAILTPQGYDIQTIQGQKINRGSETISWDTEEAEKTGFAHFTRKEIDEGPKAIANALRGRLISPGGNVKLGGLQVVEKGLKKIKHLHIVACGSAYYAGLTGAMMLEEYAKLPVTVTPASEFRYRDIPFPQNTAVLAISQSGETADTLAAIREAKEKGLLTLGIVNVVGSTIAREVKAGIYNHAGPEIGVASTKSYLSQLTILAMLAVYLGRHRSMSLVMGERIIAELTKLPNLAGSVLKLEPQIKTLAERYANFEHFIFVGRKYNYPTAFEGALKLKEISYRFAEAFPGGELKHGPLALIDDQLPTIALALKDSVQEKMLSNLEEIKTRNGPLLIIGTANDESLLTLTNDIIYIPKMLELLSPIVSIIPLQIFAYHMAIALKKDPDHPRNLAKSVTVE